MPRRMSFTATIPQIHNRSKTVTRRMCKDIYKAGDEIIAIENGMGLAKGEKQQVIAWLRITSVRKERLEMIRRYGECTKEGFPEMTPLQFIELFQEIHPGTNGFTEVTRIEFEYICDHCKISYHRALIYKHHDDVDGNVIINLCNACHDKMHTKKMVYE